MTVASFMRRHYRHFNAGTLIKAAEAYAEHVRAGGKMVISLAGAMSTAQLGISVAEMIRAGYVSAISCTGANLEEDVFNLVARDDYVPVPRWRELSREEEGALSARALNRVTGFNAFAGHVRLGVKGRGGRGEKREASGRHRLVPSATSAPMAATSIHTSANPCVPPSAPSASDAPTPPA
jgi:hypothetical protein